MSAVADAAAPRVVLLGASNLTRAISTVLGAARAALDLKPGAALDAMLAHGHGRSYGTRSTVLARSLPGIVECGLWEDLDARPIASTYALLTDVGNDIMYGVDWALLLEWLEVCLDRLQRRQAHIVMTALPMHGIRRLRAWQYRIVKALLFPGHPITYRQAMERAELVEDMLRDLAARRGVTLVEPEGTWYGLDPIHIRVRRWPQAWGRILAGWRDDGVAPTTRPSLRRFVALRTKLPHRVWLMGREKVTPQPVCRLRDGTTVAMY